MAYELDNRDKEILRTISNNARLSYNQIAKITHISKDSIRKRIIKLEKEGVILSYFPLLNYTKMGVSKFNIYCKLKSAKYLSQDKVKPLINNPRISAITWLIGEFDLELQIMARNKKEMREILQKTELWGSIGKYSAVIAGEPIIYSTNPANIKHINKPDKAISQKLLLDKKDIELIELLSINAREKIIVLAEKLTLNVDETRYRIRKLIKQEIIIGFYARTARSYMGSSRYLTLIKINRDFEKKEADSIKNVKNVYYLKKCNGSYDYLLRFYANSNEQLIKTIHTLKEILSKGLSGIKVHTIIEIIKTNPSPRLLLLDK